MDIREIVRKRMSEPPDRYGRSYMTMLYVRELTANKLAQAARVPSRTVYDFLEGGSIGSDALARILDALELRIVPAELIDGKPPHQGRRVVKITRKRARKSLP